MNAKKLCIQIVLLLLSFSLWSCASSSIPEDIKQDAADMSYSMFSTIGPQYSRTVNLEKITVTDYYIKIIGSGKPLPEDKAEGVDVVVCGKVYIEYELVKGSKTEIYHWIFKRIGDYWDYDFPNYVDETEWLMNSCPGSYNEE